MAVSKVNYGSDTLIDLTEDTVTPSNLMKGATAHDSAGNSITGILEETEITTILSADSTDDQVPSSKCVYNSIESVKGMIPSVPSWAMQSNKPSYSASEVGADASGTATSEISTHNTNTSAHNDLRLKLKGLSDRLNALADSDDTTLDQMSEIVKYIKNNKSLIDNVTTTKVNVADIIDNLTTNVSNKPLSAAQGVALKSAIDSFFGGKTVVFSDAPPTVDDQNVITFVKRG